MKVRASRPRTLTLFFSILAALVAAFACSGPALAAVDPSAPAPAISSDQADYAPGSLVTLAGSNWAPGETVHIYVNDDQGNTWSRSVDIVADAAGHIVVEFNLPDWFVATYSVTATAESGAAVTSFTDANANVSPTRVPVAAGTFQSVNAGTTSDFTVAYVKAGGGNDPELKTPILVTNPTGTCGAAGTPIPANWISVLSPALPRMITTTPTNFTYRVTVPAGQAGGTYTGRVSPTVTNGTGGVNPFDLCLSVPVVKQNQTITFNALGDRTFGDPDFAVSATASSGLAVSFSALGDCEFALGGNVQITGAGSCTITASQAGDSNYNAATAVPRSFTIAKAAATLALSNLSHTYDGSPKPATVTTTPSGLSGLTVTYDGLAAAPENAGSYAVVASLTNANYTASDASGTLVIAKAASTTSVSCPATALIYNGSARTPCTASVTGADGLDETLSVTYTDNTNAGTGHASASFAGDDNHTGSSDSATFAIEKAPSLTSVSCPASTTYTGSAQTPCTASVTGAGGLNETLTVSYSDNTNAGTAHASASFAGDDNHTGSSDVATFTIEKAPSLTSVSCPTSTTYTGSAQTPCTATTTGAGGLNETLTVAYTDNTNVGTAHAAASFAGDDNHTNSSDSATFAIAKAASTTSVSCPATALTYNGSARTPCTASVTGAGGLAETLTVTYTDNTNAGTAHASASHGGDDNHTGSSDSQTFTIEKADASVAIDWANSVYDGAANSAAASVTGPVSSDNPITSPAVSFAYYSGSTATGPDSATAPTNAGTYTVVASFAGNGNYNPDAATKTISIAKAASTTSVSCPAAALTYNGSARTPCTASVTGAGGLDETLTVTYTDNTNAGTAHASASFAGDDNYTGSTDAQTFTIDKAASATSVTCPASTTYTGSAQTPCTASATGAGGLNETLTVAYTDSTNAGTAHASASFAGDANHTGSSDAATFAIDKAASLTTVSCPATALIYNGLARTPCSATVTGAGGLSQSLPVSYTDNTNAGTGHASASFAGDDNHTGSTDAQTFTIDKAVPTVTITWAPWVFDGAAHPATGSVGGVAAPPENLGTPTFVYYSGSTATGTPLVGAPSTVGTYTVLASFAGNANYKPASATKTILVSYAWSGFLQPINDTAHQTGLAQSKFKLGQTIPAKFVIKNAAGTVVQQSGSPTFSRSGNLGSCDATAALDTITEVVPPDAGVVYNWDGSQYHYNWSTKGLTAGEYRVYANLGDGSKKYVDICLTK